MRPSHLKQESSMQERELKQARDLGDADGRTKGE